MSARAKATIGNELAPLIDLDTLRHHIAQRFDPLHQRQRCHLTWSSSVPMFGTEFQESESSK